MKQIKTVDGGFFLVANWYKITSELFYNMALAQHACQSKDFEIGLVKEFQISGFSQLHFKVGSMPLLK